MTSSKSNDLAVLANFLEHERRQYELFRSVHDSILRIGSLADAEKGARQALESAQADLAWARTELGGVHAEMESVRVRHADEIRRLEAETEEKRAILRKIIARLESVHAATDVIMEVLTGAARD
jgi:hypothetical protein